MPLPFLQKETFQKMESSYNAIDQYFTELKDTIDRLPKQDIIKVLEILQKAQMNKTTIFIFGNGGSAATASHMACDFGKNTRLPDKPRLRVISLNDNIPTLMAYANDEGYDRIFAEQLISLAAPGDIAIAISGSGNSPNVLRAVETACSLGMTTIGLTGFTGGKLKGLVHHCVIIPSNSMEQVEDIHMIIDHVLTSILRGNAC